MLDGLFLLYKWTSAMLIISLLKLKVQSFIFVIFILKEFIFLFMDHFLDFFKEFKGWFFFWKT